MCAVRRRQIRPLSAFSGWPPPEHGPFSLDELYPPIPEDLTKISFLSEDDPAAFAVYRDDATVHAACGLAGSLVPQQATPAQTAAALRAHVQQWFLQVLGVGVGMCSFCFCVEVAVPLSFYLVSSLFHRCLLTVTCPMEPGASP